MIIATHTAIAEEPNPRFIELKGGGENQIDVIANGVGQAIWCGNTKIAFNLDPYASQNPTQSPSIRVKDLRSGSLLEFPSSVSGIPYSCDPTGNFLVYRSIPPGADADFAYDNPIHLLNLTNEVDILIAHGWHRWLWSPDYSKILISKFSYGKTASLENGLFKRDPFLTALPVFRIDDGSTYRTWSLSSSAVISMNLMGLRWEDIETNSVQAVEMPPGHFEHAFPTAKGTLLFEREGGIWLCKTSPASCDEYKIPKDIKSNESSVVDVKGSRIFAGGKSLSSGMRCLWEINIPSKQYRCLDSGYVVRPDSLSPEQNKLIYFRYNPDSSRRLVVMQLQ